MMEKLNHYWLMILARPQRILDEKYHEIAVNRCAQKVMI